MIFLSRESRGGRVVSASSTALSLPQVPWGLGRRIYLDDSFVPLRDDMVSDCCSRKNLTKESASLSPIAVLAEYRYCGSAQTEGELSLTY